MFVFWNKDFEVLEFKILDEKLKLFRKIIINAVLATKWKVLKSIKLKLK